VSSVYEHLSLLSIVLYKKLNEFINHKNPSHHIALVQRSHQHNVIMYKFSRCS